MNNKTIYDTSPTLIKVENFKRQELKLLLDLCTPEQHKTFKLMYARNGGKRSVEDALQIQIDDVVDTMERDVIDWAICQTEASVTKNKNNKASET